VVIRDYFFRPRITRRAPEIKARALDALPALISGTGVKSANAKLETPTKIKNIPAILSTFFLLVIACFCLLPNKLRVGYDELFRKATFAEIDGY
jgi:hypothetical protein